MSMISGEQSPYRACACSAPATRVPLASRPSARGAASTLDEQGEDGFVADAHRHVVREVDPHARGCSGSLSGPSPSPILSRTMPAALPRNGRTRSQSRQRRQPGPLKANACWRKLLLVGWTGRPIGMPLVVVARYSNPPLRVAALRRSSREIVEAARPRRRPIAVWNSPAPSAVRSPHAPQMTGSARRAASPRI